MATNWQAMKVTLRREKTGGLTMRLQVRHPDGRFFTRNRAIAPGEDAGSYLEMALGKVEGSLEAADEIAESETEEHK